MTQSLISLEVEIKISDAIFRFVYTGRLRDCRKNMRAADRRDATNEVNEDKRWKLIAQSKSMASIHKATRKKAAIDNASLP
jgi:hypothetical protein